MNVKDLVFYNKEGNPMNLNYDETLDLWNGNIFFDKNSIDTFKTQAIYAFEKIQGTNNTFNVYLDKFQVFNTQNFNTFPIYDATPLEINNIIKTNDDALYNTKWIYVDNIEQSYYPGMWIYFTGLNSFHNTDFDEYIGNEIQGRKIITVQKGRILINTDTPNNNNLPTFIPNSNITIVPLNIIEVQQDNIEPTWNESNLNTKLYTDKKISLITNSDNNGIYTINNVINSRLKYYNKISPNLFVPVLGDKLKITLTLFTNNLPISNGITYFNNNEIQLPYVPPYLKIGDTIQAFEKSNPLNIANKVMLTITAINKLTNTITVSTILATETVDCEIYLSTNTLDIIQDILLDNNNVLSLPLTYYTLVNTWNEILSTIPGGVFLEYNIQTDELFIYSQYCDLYYNITVNKIDINNIITNYSILNYNYIIYPIAVNEQLIEETLIKDSTIYKREIIFFTIDNFGLNIDINGKSYNVDYDLNISNTLLDFQNQFTSILLDLGINISIATTNTLNDTLTIESAYPNIPVFVQMRMGDFSSYYTKYKDIEFNNIKSQLLITINDKIYLTPFNTDDITTVTNWVNTHKNTLQQFGIIVSNVNNKIAFNVIDPEKDINITYNIGYIPKSGDLSVYETNYATSATGSLIASNEIRCIPGTYNFLDYYSTGQKIAINNASKVYQNKSYNIINITPDTLTLSYQGAFWQDGLPTFDLNIISDYFIRFPRSGYSMNNIKSKLIYTWKNTQVKDFFFYDFSGNQLKPIYDNFPEYAGIKPLCGINGEIELKLNKLPNNNIQDIYNPDKQQTVFDKITYELPYIDDNINVNSEPEPLQLFIGYKADFEGTNKARIYFEIIDDVEFNLTTTIPMPNNYNDLWVFNDDYLEIQNLTNPINFNKLGFKSGQVIEISYTDINIDTKNIATLDNGGKKYKIKTVLQNKIIFTKQILNETSIKSVSKTTLPYYDTFGNALYEDRTLNVKLKVIPKVIAFFDVYGESEEEDIRYNININNKNLNLLKLQDFYIFKEVDIKENGIDWILLNRKRKELLEIYPEIFNNLASYKSVIHAINFFGYNDLTFTEYFQNINPESTKFGQLFNMELFNIFNKSVDGWQYSNLAYENLRNSGFRKTNLFSLNYKITDNEGNFINAYSLEEVRIKLLGLKKWLTENIIPLGTKIIDITGKYQMPQQFILKHETYHTQNFRVEEYASPIDFKVDGYLYPIQFASNTYDISVNFFKADNTIDWFEYKIKTFYLDIWQNHISYNVGDKVYYNNQIWKCIIATNNDNKPGVTTSWVLSNIDDLPYNQILRDYRYDDTPISFSINKLVDPHFIIEVSWHSGYGVAHKTKKSYSLIDNFILS